MQLMRYKQYLSNEWNHNVFEIYRTCHRNDRFLQCSFIWKENIFFFYKWTIHLRNLCRTKNENLIISIIFTKKPKKSWIGNHFLYRIRSFRIIFVFVGMFMIKIFTSLFVIFTTMRTWIWRMQLITGHLLQKETPNYQKRNVKIVPSFVWQLHFRFPMM